MDLVDKDLSCWFFLRDFAGFKNPLSGEDEGLVREDGGSGVLMLAWRSQNFPLASQHLYTLSLHPIG